MRQNINSTDLEITLHPSHTTNTVLPCTHTYSYCNGIICLLLPHYVLVLIHVLAPALRLLVLYEVPNCVSIGALLVIRQSSCVCVQNVLGRRSCNF